VNHLVSQGEVWRLLTPALVHANLFHLAINTLSLYMIGPSVEAILGRTRFAAVYAASAVTGNALSWWMGSTGFSMAVGASSSISGLFGAYGERQTTYAYVVSCELLIELLAALHGKAGSSPHCSTPSSLFPSPHAFAALVLCAVAFRWLNRHTFHLSGSDLSWFAQVVGINALIQIGSHSVDGWWVHVHCGLCRYRSWQHSCWVHAKEKDGNSMQ
jgi:membrane associated rhomboid family serine protease